MINAITIRIIEESSEELNINIKRILTFTAINNSK